MKLRSVVLDDEDAIRTLTCEILEERGYEVHISSEPFYSPVFLKNKCSCPVDTPCANIIITDINMHNIELEIFTKNWHGYLKVNRRTTMIRQ